EIVAEAAAIDDGASPAEDDSTRFVDPAAVSAAMAAAAGPAEPAVAAPAPAPRPQSDSPSRPMHVVNPTAEVGNEDFSSTVVIPIPTELLAAARGQATEAVRFENEGEAVEVSG